MSKNSSSFHSCLSQTSSLNKTQSNYDTIASKRLDLIEIKDTNKAKLSNSISLETVSSTSGQLDFSWSFWFHKHKKGTPWKDNIKYVTTVEYIEEFLSLYTYLYPISKMDHGCDYMFFKKGIEPMEEDIHNLDGGRWIIYFKTDEISLKFFEYYWFKMMNALVKDKFSKMDYINGAWAKVRRRGCELELWTRSACNPFVQLEIGKQLRNLLDLDTKLISYKEHTISS